MEHIYHVLGSFNAMFFCVTLDLAIFFLLFALFRGVVARILNVQARRGVLSRNDL